MSVVDRKHLLAELSEIDRIISQTADTEVIDRKSLEARRLAVQHSLEALPAPTRGPVRGRLTFRGKPVVGNHGVFAEFGAKAVHAFSDAVAAIGASQTTALGSRGAIPNRDSYQLLITGTVPGSFGFELEEAPGADNGEEGSPRLAQALKQTTRIMAASLGSDDELTEAIADTDSRALEALRSFFELLSRQDALFTMSFDDATFRFTALEELRRSEIRLKRENIHEEELALLGRFLGVLPNRRTFEFHVTEEDSVITGKVGADFEDAAEINGYLDRTCRIRVHLKRAGAGHPTYTLLAIDAQTT